jgi:endogenous inhibitor of DNA gyrase (YacG/DUF329 family)
MESPNTARWPDFPFCSARCRLIDLGRWLGEKYTVPANADEEVSEPPTTDEDSLP